MLAALRAVHVTQHHQLGCARILALRPAQAQRWPPPTVCQRTGTDRGHAQHGKACFTPQHADACPPPCAYSCCVSTQRPAPDVRARGARPQQGVINDLVLLSTVGIRPVLVHGGGPEINIWLNKLGIEAQFKNGLRVTDGAPCGSARISLAVQVVHWALGRLSLPSMCTCACGKAGRQGLTRCCVSGRGGRLHACRVRPRRRARCRQRCMRAPRA